MSPLRSGARIARRLARPLIRGLGGVPRQEFDAVLARTAALEEHLSARLLLIDSRESRIVMLEQLEAIRSLSAWLSNVPVRHDTLITIVLPTADRPHLLSRAVASVLAQRHPAWELLIVDDGMVESRFRPADNRIRVLRTNGEGVCAARNAALAVARGSLIAYLDDDNVMDPGWLHAVAWAFAERPAADVLYGAFTVDDPLRIKGPGSGALPTTYLHPWSREQLRRSNLADIGAVAHRRGLSQATFDVTLREMGDWDLLLRLTEVKDPLVLPAVACYYTTDAPFRLTGGPTHLMDQREVLGRAAKVLTR